MSTLYYNNEDLSGLAQQKILAKFVGIDLTIQKITSKATTLALHDNGILLNDANAISMHLGNNSALLGKSFEEEVQIYSWLEYINIEVLPLIQQIEGQISGTSQPNEVRFNYSVQELKKALKIFDDSLKLKSFLVSDNVTLADILLCLHLSKPFQFVFPPEVRKKFVNLTRWYSFTRNQHPFIQTLGPVILCQTVFVPSQDGYNKEVQQKEPQIKQKRQEVEPTNSNTQKSIQNLQAKQNEEQNNETQIGESKQRTEQQITSKVVNNGN